MPEQAAKKIIMAVDDMPVNLAAVRNILSQHYDVRPIKSAKTALMMLNTVKVDLVLLDIEMPEMSGFEFLDRIRNNPEYSEQKDIPVIFITSHGAEDMAARAKSGGAQDYVVKPFEPAVLLKKIGSLLAAENPPAE
ncbi:MAG: response regulator [Treponema sp.]|jgi:CheY-like chemotaxis protein|nr:response regulator [Treponema sp.]